MTVPFGSQSGSPFHVVVEGEDLEFLAKLFVIAEQGSFIGFEIPGEVLARGERLTRTRGSSSRSEGRHGKYAPATLRSLKPSSGSSWSNPACRSIAHVDEGARAVKGERREPLLGPELFGVRLAYGLPSIASSRASASVSGSSSRSNICPERDDPAHTFFELGKIGIGKRTAQKKVVIEAVFDGRTETPA